MSSAWEDVDHANAALIRTRLQHGPANRNQLADQVEDLIKLGLALGLLHELGEIESDPPFATPERGWPRIYSLRASAPLEPLPLLSNDEPYEGDAGGPEVPEDEDVPGVAAAGRWSSKAPPPPGSRPPSRSISGVLEVAHA